MAPNTTLFSAIFVLLAIFSTLETVQSKHTKHNPFGFIKKLEGCHKGQNISGLYHLKQYLQKFGYLNPTKNDTFQTLNHHQNDDEFDDFLESAVKLYQRNFHLKVTGTLDADTVAKMSTPRCGNPDIIHESTPNPRKVKKNPRKLINAVSHYSFMTGNHRWQKSHLTYRFRSSVADSAINSLHSVTARAFQKWARVTHFTFQEVPATAAADIEIGFHRGNHGDGEQNKFDGRFGTLAHAARPPIGLFHFDADEDWSTNPGAWEVDLESVAVHEIGHVLGLGHEPRIPEAIMYPEFNYGSVKRNLHEDDIKGIRALYGLN